MDSKLTGKLIAQRRGELGLTQKQLAQQLNVSDRAVSRWERGVGFPDLSLLEPLADTLGLSIPELLHGELSPERSKDPDISARETLRALGVRMGARLKKARKALILLSVLLALAAAALVWLIADPIGSHEVSTKPISAAEAAVLCPDVFISTEEYRLMETFSALPEIQALFSDDGSAFLEDSFSEPYRERVLVNGKPPDYFRISVIGRSLWVEYGTDLNSRILTLYTVSGKLEKCAARYSGQADTLTGPDANGVETTIYLGRDPDYILLNRDNEAFFRAVSR